MSGATIAGDVLASQVAASLANGGVLGDVLGYSETDYEAVYALGHGLYANARYLDAAKAFGFLVMSNPYERRFVTAYAGSLQMLKQYRDAIAYHSMASVMDLSDPAPTFHTAECLMALGMRTEAAQAFGFVLKQCSRPAQAALKDRAQALLQLMQQEPAQ
jgi:type III secretion system low calcium response chaperone LcrH/SycD